MKKKLIITISSILFLVYFFYLWNFHGESAINMKQLLRLSILELFLQVSAHYILLPIIKKQKDVT